MRDSMHILDVLRERDYEPQEDAKPDEAWLDHKTADGSGGSVRVVMNDSEVIVFQFDRYGVHQWEATFSDGAPSALIITAIKAAEAGYPFVRATQT